MSVAFTHKEGKRGRKKYFYYRCGSVGHRGKAACRIKQIGVDRLHDLVYRNLVRLSVDTENLKNLVFSLQNQTRPTLGEGFEPLQEFRHLTPEKLQKDLTAYVKSCARKTGIEKVYAMRKGIGRIHYSKKSVRVDYAFGGFLEPSKNERAGEPGGGSASFSDENERFQPGGPLSARSAANGTNSSVSASVLDREGAVRSGFPSAPAPTKRPNGFEPLSLSTPSGGFSKTGTTENLPTLVPLDFPNIAHGYWENYRLTGEYYLPGPKGRD